MRARRTRRNLRGSARETKSGGLVVRVEFRAIQNLGLMPASGGKFMTSRSDYFELDLAHDGAGSVSRHGQPDD